MAVGEEDLLRCEQCGAPFESSTSAYGCLNCLLLGGKPRSIESITIRFPGEFLKLVRHSLLVTH